MIPRTSVGIVSLLSKSKDFLANLEKRKTEMPLSIEGIENCSVSLNRVESAQSDYENSTQVAQEAKLLFESQLAKSERSFNEIVSYLKVALRGNLEKQNLLIFKEEVFISAWLHSAGQFYRRLLADPELFIILGDFCISKEDILSSQEELNLTLSAYEVLINNRDGIAAAINKRDDEWAKLLILLASMQVQIYKKVKDPQIFKKIELPIIHDEVGQMISMVKDSSIT